VQVLGDISKPLHSKTQNTIRIGERVLIDWASDLRMDFGLHRISASLIVPQAGSRLDWATIFGLQGMDLLLCIIQTSLG
jgi:hypothetical protein